MELRISLHSRSSCLYTPRAGDHQVGITMSSVYGAGVRIQGFRIHGRLAHYQPSCSVNLLLFSLG